MPRKKKNPDQLDALDLRQRLTTATCVPVLREKVGAWRKGGYKKTTDTTQELLNFWFESDHRLPDGNKFRYYDSQRQAIETLIYVYEVEKIRSRKQLLEKFASDTKDLRLPPFDNFARFCIKMATGSGKTKVMSLAIAWQYFNAAREDDGQYAKNFLILAPNVIVFERLRVDFESGKVFRSDPLFPKHYYARRIAQNLKLPAQFAALAPKIREFFQKKAFGKKVDLYDAKTIKAMSTNVASYVVCKEFEKALKDVIVEKVTPTLETSARMMSDTPPFPFSRKLHESHKTVFNFVACDNEFELTFAIFLHGSEDIEAFAKIPQQFGFSIPYTDTRANIRHYYPDFAVRLKNGEHWLIETKGQEDITVRLKDQAARNWCENATSLTDETWQYLKVRQKEFEALHPDNFSELSVALVTPEAV